MTPDQDGATRSELAFLGKLLVLILASIPLVEVLCAVFDN